MVYIHLNRPRCDTSVTYTLWLDSHQSPAEWLLMNIKRRFETLECDSTPFQAATREETQLSASLQFCGVIRFRKCQIKSYVRASEWRPSCQTQQKHSFCDLWTCVNIVMSNRVFLIKDAEAQMLLTGDAVLFFFCGFAVVARLRSDCALLEVRVWATNYPGFYFCLQLDWFPQV